MLSMNSKGGIIMDLLATKRVDLASAVLIAALAFSLVSCQDNTVGGNGDYDEPLELTGVRYQNPDSTESPEELNPGDLVALEGQNMNSVARVYFNGIEVDFNPALASNDHLVVSVPGDLPFGEIDPESEEFGTVRVENTSSEASLDVPILPPAPDLQEMSNEHAFAGDEVTLYGQYLYLIESVTFPGGVTVGTEDVESEPDGSSVTLTIPDGVDTSMNGTISITTVAGSDDSDPSFLFHGYRGVLLDMHNGGGPIAEARHAPPQVEEWDWWSAIHPYSGDVYQESGQDHVEGAEGDFIMVEQAGRDEIGGGNGAWWGSYRSVNLTNSEWVAPENLGESSGNFALKFEMSILGEWNAGTFRILLPEANYAAEIEPWLNEDGSTSPVSYSGWRTFTVPLNEFGADGGSGGTTNSLETLLGSDGVADYGPEGNAPGFRFINDTERALPAGVSFAIDKIRVVRIAESE